MSPLQAMRRILDRQPRAVGGRLTRLPRMADDDVQLTDLEVIQRYSLAVRGATASRAEVVAALQADLSWLQGGRAKAPARTTAKDDDSAAGAKTPAKKAPAKTAAKRKA